MGAYLCIASNEVPPAVSKRVYLMVQCESLDFNIFTDFNIFNIFDIPRESASWCNVRVKNSIFHVIFRCYYYMIY